MREFEPRTALTAGPDGLDDVRAVLACAAEKLDRGGVLLMEIGYGQAEAVRSLIVGTPAMTLTRISSDLQAIPRIVIAQRS